MYYYFCEACKHYFKNKGVLMECRVIHDSCCHYGDEIYINQSDFVRANFDGIIPETKVKCK